LATHVRSSPRDLPRLKEKIYCVSCGTSLHLLLLLLLLLHLATRNLQLMLLPCLCCCCFLALGIVPFSRICDTTFNEIFPLHLAHHHATFQLQLSVADLLQHMLQKPPTATANICWGISKRQTATPESGAWRLRLRYDGEVGEDHQRHLRLQILRLWNTASSISKSPAASASAIACTLNSNWVWQSGANLIVKVR